MWIQISIHALIICQPFKNYNFCRQMSQTLADTSYRLSLTITKQNKLFHHNQCKNIAFERCTRTHTQKKSLKARYIKKTLLQ